MERLTKRLPNGVIHVDFAKQKESVMGRLAAIEDILGDEYDLERLKFIMDAELPKSDAKDESLEVAK